MLAPHPPEFRQRAVELARLKEQPIAQVAKGLGISESCLRNWLETGSSSKCWNRPFARGSAFARRRQAPTTRTKSLVVRTRDRHSLGPSCLCIVR